MKPVTAICVLCLSAVAAAAPFSNELETKVAETDDVSAALPLAKGEVTEIFAARLGEKGKGLFGTDAPVIAAQGAQIKRILRGKELPKGKENQAVLAAWMQLRIRPGSDPEKKLDTDALLKALGEIEYVEITSVPPGADIAIDGHVGWEETDDDGFLPRGELTIRLKKTGYKRVEERINVKKDRNRFSFKLEKAD